MQLGNTYPIFGTEKTLTERLGDRALADYIRWEYRRADREIAILSARGGALLGVHRSRPPPRRPLLRRFRAWLRHLRISGQPTVVATEASVRD